jgi:hypothetical protein
MPDPDKGTRLEHCVVRLLNHRSARERAASAGAPGAVGLQFGVGPQIPTQVRQANVE